MYVLVYAQYCYVLCIGVRSMYIAFYSTLQARPQPATDPVLARPFPPSTYVCAYWTVRKCLSNHRFADSQAIGLNKGIQAFEYTCMHMDRWNLLARKTMSVPTYCLVEQNPTETSCWRRSNDGAFPRIAEAGHGSPVRLVLGRGHGREGAKASRADASGCGRCDVRLSHV